MFCFFRPQPGNSAAAKSSTVHWREPSHRRASAMAATLFLVALRSFVGSTRNPWLDLQSPFFWNDELRVCIDQSDGKSSPAPSPNAFRRKPRLASRGFSERVKDGRHLPSPNVFCLQADFDILGAGKRRLEYRTWRTMAFAQPL